jgi:hypothetical protein
MKTTQNDKKNVAPIDALVDTVRAQGQLWARYGLTIGRLALETNSRALGQLASSLGKLAEALDAKAATPSAPRAPDASAPANDEELKN